jgi:hypothetical protein
MLRLVRCAGFALSLAVSVTARAVAQTPPLVFTTAMPEASSSNLNVQSSAVIEERALALWSGETSDLGVGVALSSGRWSVRSVTSITTLPIDGRSRPTFQQVDVVRHVFSKGSASLAGGGGLRQQVDGTRVLIGRALVGVETGGGRLQGSFVLERTIASPVKHDAADLVTSIGWSRAIGGVVSLGAEAVGQDLEGLWDRGENEGGAKLLLGPSIHAKSPTGRWSASVTAGPVVQTVSTASGPALQASPHSSGIHHLGFFASATWTP